MPTSPGSRRSGKADWPPGTDRGLESRPRFRKNPSMADFGPGFQGPFLFPGRPCGLLSGKRFGAGPEIYTKSKKSLGSRPERVMDQPSGRQNSGIWGLSSVGRAPQWHCGGQRFESARLHQIRTVLSGSCSCRDTLRCHRSFTRGLRVAGNFCHPLP
ncbi:MAG: hypothetical protein JWM59_3666 [Verrucomicrobiales bacterium]|nr:hypothetical protein [Verrucomicrobiales bacterium]